MGNDAGFMQFFTETQSVHKFGFKAMITLLVFLKGTFTVSVFLSCEGKTRYALSTFAALLSVVLWLAWSPILSAASCLFS